MKLISEHGFSLVELIVVITIIIILLSLVIPLINLNRYRIENCTQIIYSTLLKTRQIAVAEAEDYSICLLPGNRLGIKKSSESSYLKVIELDKEISLSCTRSNNQVKFTPLGTAVSGSFNIFDEAYSKRVVVAGNGFIRIE